MKLSTINKAIREKGYELVKGKDYFYFWPLTNETKLLCDDSVMTSTLGQDMKFWIDELDSKIRDNNGS